MTTPRDYDDNPDRYRTGMRLAGTALYERVAGLLRGRVLDLGCGEGVLSQVAGPSAQVVSLDASPAMLAALPGPAIQADARALPFKPASFDTVTAINVLDHLTSPRDALHEAHRVLRPGGRFIAGAISRTDSPEFHRFWTPPPTPFDSEEAPGIVASVFGEVQVHPWDGPLLTLPDRESVRQFLVARFVADAAEVASHIEAPLTVTKRGALILATRY